MTGQENPDSTRQAAAEKLTPFRDAAHEAVAPNHQVSVGDLLDTIREHRPKLDIEFIRIVAEFARDQFKAVRQKTRSNGGAMARLVESPVGSAITLAYHNFTGNGIDIMAGLLHPIVAAGDAGADALKEKLAARFFAAQRKGRHGARSTGKINRRSNFEKLREDFPVQADIVDRAFDLAEDAALITHIPRGYAGQATPEDHITAQLAMMCNPLVAIIKIAANIEVLRAMRFRGAAQEETARILDISEQAYAPMAEAVGWNTAAGIIKDQILFLREPGKYKALVEKIEAIPGYEGLYSDPKKWRDMRRNTAERIRRLAINASAGFRDIDPSEMRIAVRRKSLASIAEKVERKSLAIEEVHDIIAARIVTPNTRDKEQSIQNCYLIFGALQGGLAIIPGTRKNYIAEPKGRYQSLHQSGTLDKISGTKAPVKLEIQVRDQDMEITSEVDIDCSHLIYSLNKNRKPGDESPIGAYYLERSLSARLYLTDSLNGFSPTYEPPPEIYVANFMGRLFAVPNEYAQGKLTPMDAIVHIYDNPEEAIYAHKASCNGIIVNLDNEGPDTILKNGSRVVVIEDSIDKNRPPATAWTAAVKTPRARDALTIAQASSTKPRAPAAQNDHSVTHQPR